MKWTTKGFEAFRRGKFGNGGQNIYVSKAGVLQRIHQTDINRNGYMDLIFCSSQAHEELVPIEVYPDPINHPENLRRLYIGGADDGVVADLTGDGMESMAWSCVWDGMTWLNLSAIYYGSEEGPSGRYVKYLPANRSAAVAAGDFNGDGRIDLVFYSAGELKFFWQDELGFCPVHQKSVPAADVKRMVGYKFPGDAAATLFLYKKDGSVTMIKGDPKQFAEAPAELPVFGPDPDYKEVKFSWDSYTQAVAKPAPHLQIVKIEGRDYLTLFRQTELYLYPCGKNGLGKQPVKIACRNGMALAAGDIFNRGVTDLVIAARDGVEGKEHSYLFPGSAAGWGKEKPIAIATGFATDVALGRFSGGPGLDIVISQGRTNASYDNDVLLFSTSTLKKPAIPRPSYLPSHDVDKILVIKDTRGRDYLVLGNGRSGSFIGNPDNDIYFGSASGYHQNDKMTLPGWGSVDVVCCDLNDNGRCDLVFANASELAPWLDPGSYVLHQKEDGSFGRQPQCLKTSRAHGVVCGDFNHNGYLDLALAGFDNPILKIFYGSAEGYKEENAVEIPMVDGDKEYRQPRFIGLADLNGNGYLDLIITMISEDVSFVLWGGPDGFSFANRQNFRVRHACNCKVADLNGDGYPELIWGGHSPTPGVPHDAYLYIYWGGPNGYSESRCTLLPSNAVNSISIADFNNDGLLDIFIASYQNAKERDLPSYIYWNSPEGFAPDRRTELATHAVSGSIAADLDGDGYIDLAIANHKVYGNHIAYSTVWQNGPNGFDPKKTVNLTTSGPHGMGNVDPGNILDRSFNEYYESEPHKIPAGCGVSEIYWDADIPHKCGVYAQFRTADTLEDLALADWFGPTNRASSFNAHDYVEKARFSGKYMQYRLNLYAYNALNTPRVRSVTVEFEKL